MEEESRENTKSYSPNPKALVTLIALLIIFAMAGFLFSKQQEQNVEETKNIVKIPESLKDSGKPADGAKDLTTGTSEESFEKERKTSIDSYNPRIGEAQSIGADKSGHVTKLKSATPKPSVYISKLREWSIVLPVGWKVVEDNQKTFFYYQESSESFSFVEKFEAKDITLEQLETQLKSSSNIEAVVPVFLGATPGFVYRYKYLPFIGSAFLRGGSVYYFHENELRPLLTGIKFLD